MKYFAIAAVVAAGFAPTCATTARACDLGPDMDWAIQEDGRNCGKDYNNDGAGQIRYGACKKDAAQLHDGFHKCQHGDALKHFDACTAGEQIDTARSIARKYGYMDASCGPG